MELIDLCNSMTSVPTDVDQVYVIGIDYKIKNGKVFVKQKQQKHETIKRILVINLLGYLNLIARIIQIKRQII